MIQFFPYVILLIWVGFIHIHMRAKSVVHVEYEIFLHILDEIEIESLEKIMVEDKHSKKRFEDGAAEVFKLINNLAQRRLHRLPKNHPDFKEK